METTAVADPGFPLPSLPGPKPRDYHFTRNTDSSFVFNTSEDLNTREHAFFVYAVDNKGKADPTPARFMFRALDRFPPVIYFDPLETKGTGRTFTIQQTGPTTGIRTAHVADYPIRDSLNQNTVPSDTVPSGSLLTFKWRAEPRIRGTYVAGFRYKLDETVFNTVDSSVHVATYNTGIGGDVVTPGLKVFTLKAVGQSGYAGSSTRRFMMNFDPDTWYAGPDKTDPAQGWTFFSDLNGRRYYYKNVVWGSATNPTASVPNTMLSADSLNVLPTFRPEKRTFFEFYNDRIYYHEEGDTVNMNSWVMFPAGGVDRDSPYRVDVNARDIPAGGPFTVLTPDSANGSPAGFHVRGITQTDGPLIYPAESSKYPVFNVSSVFHQPYINAYLPMTLSGKEYVVIRAEDGDGAIDGRIVDGVSTAERLPASDPLRSKVMTFYVNRAPFLLTTQSGFRPAPNFTFTSRNWEGSTGTNAALNLPAFDPDPYYQGVTTRPVGGSNFNGNRQVLRRAVYILGKTVDGADTTVIATLTTNPADSLFIDNAIVPVHLPARIANGPLTVRVRLCDCDRCDEFPGSGRCIIRDFPVILNAPSTLTSAEAAPASSSANPTQRPGSPSAVRRSY